MTYNLTNITNDYTILTFLSYSNEVTGGYMGLALLIMVYAIPFVALVVGYGEVRAAASAVWVGSVGSILLVYIGLVPLEYALLMWVISAGVIAWIVVNSG